MPISQSDYLAMKGRTEKARGLRSEQPTSDFGDKPGTMAPAKAPKRLRQSSKPLLNKLETEFHAYLCERFGPQAVFSQAVRLMLANGIWYKCDFVVFTPSEIRFYEVKGPKAFRGGFENLKIAANRYPFKFVLAWKHGPEWLFQEILP